jgi:acyl-CoA synthetase (AMP-forming)/AMP-acid ligase II
LQVEQYLENSARRYPCKPALICGPERFMYAETDRRSNRFASTLVAHGVRKGDEVLGQAIKAITTLREGAQFSRQEILRLCPKHLEDFKIPQKVEFRVALPKTPNGKIVRRELQSFVETQA